MKLKKGFCSKIEQEFAELKWVMVIYVAYLTILQCICTFIEIINWKYVMIVQSRGF